MAIGHTGQDGPHATKAVAKETSQEPELGKSTDNLVSPQISNRGRLVLGQEKEEQIECNSTASYCAISGTK